MNIQNIAIEIEEPRRGDRDGQRHHGERQSGRAERREQGGSPTAGCRAALPTPAPRADKQRNGEHSDQGVRDRLAGREEPSREFRGEFPGDARPDKDAGDQAHPDRSSRPAAPRSQQPKKQRERGRDADKQAESEREEEQGMAVLHSVAL